MGRFLKKFYDGESVAANDIGAINYLARLRCMDLWGLGTRDVMLHKRSNTYCTAVIRDIATARGVRAAVVYTRWFRGKMALPEEWTEVGTWQIKNNVICAESTVTFMATCPSEVPTLRRSLRAFSAELPAEVIWKELLP